MPVGVEVSMRNARFLEILLVSLVFMTALVTAVADVAPDYSNPTMLAYPGMDEQGEADVFFIAPTNVMGSADYLNVDLSNADDLYAIRWAIAMQTGTYNTDARFYQPVEAEA